MLSKVFLKLTTGKQENLNLIHGNSTNINNEKEFKNYKSKFAIVRDNLINLSDHEKKLHENFINEMTDPLWKKI